MTTSSTFRIFLYEYQKLEKWYIVKNLFEILTHGFKKVRAIVFELCCNDTEGEDVEVPYVKYNLPKRQWLPLSLGEQQFESLHIITILFLPDPHAFAPHSPDFYNPTPWVASLFGTPECRFLVTPPFGGNWKWLRELIFSNPNIEATPI